MYVSAKAMRKAPGDREGTSKKHIFLWEKANVESITIVDNNWLSGKQELLSVYNLIVALKISHRLR